MFDWFLHSPACRIQRHLENNKSLSVWSSLPEASLLVKPIDVSHRFTTKEREMPHATGLQLGSRFHQERRWWVWGTREWMLNFRSPKCPEQDSSTGQSLNSVKLSLHKTLYLLCNYFNPSFRHVKDMHVLAKYMLVVKIKAELFPRQYIDRLKLL